MGRRCETLETTLEALRNVGLSPMYERTGGQHYRIKCDGLPHIIVSSTASDTNAKHQARRYVERFIRTHVLKS